MPKNPHTIQPDLLIQAIQLMATGQKFVLTIARLQGHAFTAMMRYPIEALGFLRHRYEQDMKLVDDLVAFDTYAGFFEKAVADYSMEAGKVATMSSEIASEAGKRMQKEADIITKDVTAASEKIAEVAAA